MLITEAYGLNPQFPRGQGCDGTGNMASHIRGTASTLATYMYCFLHKLNLAIVNVCQVQVISNAIVSLAKLLSSSKIHPRGKEHWRTKLKPLNSPIEGKSCLTCVRLGGFSDMKLWRFSISYLR